MRKFVKTKKLLHHVLASALLLVCAQNALAQCAGTVYFKAPSDWTEAYVGGYGASSLGKMTLNENGYYEYNLLDLKIPSGYDPKFAIANQDDTDGLIIVSTKGFGISPTVASASWPTYDANIPCPGAGNILYVTQNPNNPSRTYTGDVPPDAKFFYVLLPEGKEWLFDELMLRYTMSNGTVKDTAMVPAGNMCGWFYMFFAEFPSDAVLYRKNSPDSRIGQNGLQNDGGAVNPIDLNKLVKVFDSENLYFIPDAAMRPGAGDGGWYGEDPGVDGVCKFALAALIYDTDMYLNEVFTDCCAEDRNLNSKYETCVGVHHGIVNVDLGADNKPVYSGSANAVKCFGNEENFKTLFNYTPNKNEVVCYNIPFRHYGKDARWGFDSDSMVMNGLTGGFYPVENTTNADILTINGETMGPEPRARMKRPAAGPVPNNAEAVFGVDMDHVCSTPGYAGKMDCEGYFASGDEFSSPDLWCWGSYCEPGFTRWGYDGESAKTEKRNQHYCFESHATFTYRENQEFSIRGDDDIWVFINKKLAVDNGGTHLPAPGYVVLKNLNDTYEGTDGGPFLVPGQDYPLDIFYCDRRTTMSNLIIKTNIAFSSLVQSSSISISPHKVGSSAERLDICVEWSGGGDCASVALGGTSQPRTECGDDISSEVYYSIITSKGEAPANCDNCSALALGSVGYGGIDLTNPKKPVVYSDRIAGLASGDYRLVVNIDGQKAYYNFSVAGESEEDVSSSSAKASSSSSGAKATSSSSGNKTPGSNGSGDNDSGEGDSGDSDDDSDEGVEFAKPSFRVKMVGPFEFKIVMDEELPAKARAYAVMDMQGNVLRQGEIASVETPVEGLKSGSYIVKVGLGHRRVNIR